MTTRYGSYGKQCLFKKPRGIMSWKMIFNLHFLDSRIRERVPIKSNKPAGTEIYFKIGWRSLVVLNPLWLVPAVFLRV